MALSGEGASDYRAGILPTDFHQRVVDLEIKVEGRPLGGGS